MPAILSKLRGGAVDAVRAHPTAAATATAALLAGGVALLGARALRGLRADAPPRPHANGKCTHANANGRNNNVYGDGAESQHAQRCREDKCGGSECALCRGDARCDNRQLPDTEEDEGSDSSTTSQKRAPRIPGLNMEFVKQLVALIRIMIPGPKSKEAMILSVHTLCLFTRTFLSIYVANLEGSIVKYIVKKDLRNFAMMLLQWLGIAVPATFINSMIRFLENKLALSFRTRLVKYAYGLYFKNQTYYRVGNIDGRIENPEHRLTDDVSTLATSCAHLYGHLTKPLFDLLLITITLATFATKMKANIFTGPALAVVVIGATGLSMRALSPGFGALAAEEARRKAGWRYAHSRLTQHSEEVAFYAGHNVEQRQLLSSYHSLSEQMMCVYRARLWYVMLEQFCMKYVWSGTGMVILALPVLTGKGEGSGIGERTQYLTTSKNLLTSAADAIERLLSSYKEIVTLAGYTERVWSMLTVFGEVAQGKYILSTVSSSQPSKHPQDNTDVFRLKFRDGQPISEGKIHYSSDHTISIRGVPIVTPGCDIVVSNLDLDIMPGHHLLIVGPNGCGKSSLFRIISGLWPIYGGELTVPEPCSCVHCSSTNVRALPAIAAKPKEPSSEGEDTDEDLEDNAEDDLMTPIVTGHCERRPIMFYIPQRPYMTVGSLAEQVSYPAPAPRGKLGARRARAILRLVRLDHVLRRHGLNAVGDWRITLSGGEKQRMAMARMFYHRPVYALLDECTSAVSAETEVTLYEAALQVGITLLSITHRPSVWKYHKHILEFDGHGNWSHRPLSQEQKELKTIDSAVSAQKTTEATIAAQKTTEKSP